MEIGIDVGGTKIAAGLVHNGRVIRRVSMPTAKSRAEIIKQLKGIIVELSDAEGKRPARVGIGVPGFFKGTKIIHLPHIPALNGVDLRRALRIPVVLENDARCFAQAEHLMGAGKGARNSVSITLGTGVGSGIIIDGRIYRGSHGGAGEIGHLRIPAEGMAEFEHLLSGPGIIARHRARGGSEDHPARIWESRTPEAKATREETEAFLATFAENIIMMLDPDVIILGGGVSNLPLTPSANRLLRAHNHKPILRQGKLGDDAGIIGAALIAKG